MPPRSPKASSKGGWDGVNRSGTSKGPRRAISGEKAWRYVRLRIDQGMSRADVCRELGVSNSQGVRFEQAISAEPDIVESLRGEFAGGKIGADPDLAARCLDDFGLFRATVFGRSSLPWAVDAADRVRGLWESPDREFAVANIAPGAGKTTLFTLDIPAWLTVRSRSIRGAIGSVKLDLSIKMTASLRREFERQSPLRASEAKRMGRGAADAMYTMPQLFGRFRPLSPDTWRREGFIVEGGGDTGDKELTWSAASMTGEFIGERLDFMSWDDPQTVSRVRSDVARETDRESWDEQIENRLEPGGLLLVVMQRLHVDDISRHCLNKYVLIEGDDDQEHRASKYHHIVFAAHDKERCEGEHGRDTPAWPDGCLLDPKTLSWRYLEQQRSSDPQKFELVFQQNDQTGSARLVQGRWVDGGQDPESGELYVGCWDPSRAMGQIPADLTGKVRSYAVIDPSATNWWALEWWLWEEATQRRYLIDFLRVKAQANEIIDFYPTSKRWGGYMNEWQQRSETTQHRITWWIVEQNAAQRFMLVPEHMRLWRQHHQVRIIGHETGINKLDPRLGVEGILPNLYRSGLKRLPGTENARQQLKPFVAELTGWPDASTNDCVMADWMGEFRLERTIRHHQDDLTEVQRQWRPPWMTGNQPTEKPSGPGHRKLFGPKYIELPEEVAK